MPLPGGKKMNHKIRLVLYAVAGLLIFGIVGVGAGAEKASSGDTRYLDAARLSAQPAGPANPLTPTGNGFTYQGKLLNDGSPATGSYDMRFTLFDALTGNGQIGTPFTMNNQAVADGLFTVQLDFGIGVFGGDARYLQIEVKLAGGPSYTTLSPRQPLTAAPYALFALDVPAYDNVVVVAKSGGDFVSVQAALDSITDATEQNHYLVWIAPGVYTETVTMKEFVDIEGSGQLSTRITYVGSPEYNTGTIVGASSAELRDITVVNTGGGANANGIYNNNASPRLTRIALYVNGANAYNIGVYNDDHS